MIHKILCWAEGYLVIDISGLQTEKMMNVCRNHGLYWWKIGCDRKKQKVRACITREDLQETRQIAEKLGISLEIIDSRGGYFLANKAWKRGSFWLGVFLCFLLLCFFSDRVWGIEVEGNSYHSKESVWTFLEQKNIYGGMRTKDVVCSEVEEEIRKHFADVGWASIEKSGSKLYVRMEEVILPQKKEKASPGSLIAEKDGIVDSIVTRKGVPKVRAGDTVKRGKTLISGRLKMLGDNQEVIGRKHVRAAGTVILKCQEKYEDVLPVVYQKKRYTGRKRTIYQFCIGKKDVFFYNPLKSLETYKKCDIIREGGRLCPFLSMRFPIFVWKKTFYETKYAPAKLSEKEAKRIMGERYAYYKNCMKQHQCDCVSDTFYIQRRGDCYYASSLLSYLKKQRNYQTLSELSVIRREKEEK